MVLKKRILIIGDSLEELLLYSRTLPQFVCHRQDWTILRPLLTQDAEHIEDISTCGFYVGGTLDEGLCAHSDLYDILFSIREKRVIVATHATEAMKMTSIHRDLATLVTELVENSATSLELMKAITAKNSQIIENLRQCLDEEGKVTEASINARVSNPVTQQWLLRLGIAERM